MTMTWRERACAGAAIAIVGAFSVLVAAQNWRARTPGPDVLPYIEAAHTLLSSGRLPDHGPVTSLSSYAPPGYTWSVLPGVWLFSDPRLFDVPGTAILFVGTLIGVFLLAEACAGVKSALLAVVLYGCSGAGLQFAATMGQGSLGPRGHPIFYVWMAVWLCRWVTRNDGRYLAAAVLTWCVGMYVFMEIAPAILMVPAVWFFYRPPIRIGHLAVACAVAAAIWYPHLRFESERGFMDLRSQLLLTNLEPASDPLLSCDATPVLRRWATAPAAESIAPPSGTTRVGIAAGGRLLAIGRGLVGNFEGSVPGSALVLFVLAIGGLLVLGQPAAAFAAGPTRLTALTAAAVGLLAWSVIANELVVERVLGPRVHLGLFALPSIRFLQALTALAGIALLARRPLAAWIRALTGRRPRTTCDPRALVLCLIVPWAVLLLVAEPGRQDRLVALSPFQFIAIAFFVVAISERWTAGARIYRGILVVAVTVITVITPVLLGRIESWRRDGWSGTDPVEIRAADRLATRLRSAGRQQAAIGYQLFLEAPLEPPWRAVDTDWKVGGEVDAFLEYRYGILNTDRCGEGLSAQDEYRVIETRPPAPESPYYFELPTAGRLRLVDRVDTYEVYESDRFR